MSKRINVILPDSTVAVLDRVAPKGARSRFIDRAVRQLVRTEGRANIRERLKAGALANADENLRLAQEWFPAEHELWQKLEREERLRGKKTIRSAGKSTSRRSTRR
ncbi:MAG TPA: hypothetical protein VH640_08285 [Bryobacteraceae bacterium]|jgi:metal-responsive CopG/Arc/MetJ family transcriptional regulator